MIAQAYDEKYKADQDIKRMIKAIADLWTKIDKGGGNPFFIASYDKLCTMTGLELIDLLSKNGISFKNN